MEGNDMKFCNDRLAKAEFNRLKVDRNKFDKDHKRFKTLTEEMSDQVMNAFMFQIEYNFQKDSPEPIMKRRRTTRVITDSEDEDYDKSENEGDKKK